MCVAAVPYLAAAFLMCCVCVFGRPAAADDDEARVILFSGRDIARNGVFAHGGILFAPGGFEQDGLLFKALISGGLYRYFSQSLGGQRIYGAEGTLQLLPGWRIKRGDLELKFFFGLDLEQHRLWPDDPFNLLQGRSLGVRIAVDLWYEPTPSTMAAMDASIGSIGTNHSARAAFGWRVIDEQFYFGPEAAVFAAQDYRQVRVGGHFTAMKTGNTEWTAAGGWARDSDGQSGAYVRLNLMKKL
jgi:cellulose biosynthesis protein BcsS